MASFTIYDPKIGEFRALDIGADLPMTELLLVNILIELQSQTNYLAAQNPMEPNGPDAQRSSIVSNI